jgi:putative redox protein
VSEQRVTWSGEGFAFQGLDQLGRVVHIDTDPAGPGAKPADLLPISLAACTAWDVVNILQKQRQDLRGLDVRIETDQDPDPPWAFTRIVMHFTITGDVDGRKAERAVELSEEKYCAVAASLRPSVAIGLTVRVVPGDQEP